MRLAEGFFDLYAGLPRAHGIYAPKGRTGEKNKVSGRATTVHEELTTGKWEKHLEGEQGLGVIPIRDDATVMWGAIDIDQYQNFDLVALENKIDALHLPLVVIRTKSGGAHVTMYMDEPHSAAYVRSKLQMFAVALGYPGIEIFPKQKQLANDRDVGNWLNMPYFDHERTTRYAIRQGQALTAEEFLEYAGSKKTNKESLEAIGSLLSDDFGDGPPCLQTLASTGGFPQGARNDGLFSVGVYCRLKFGDEWEPELDLYNTKMMEHPLGSKEVQQVVTSLKRKKDYFYKCSAPPLVGVCNKELCRSRKYGVGHGAPEEPSLSLGSLEKIDKDPPTFYLDIEGYRVELETEDLLRQDRFRKVVFEKRNKLWKKLPDRIWEPILQNLLDNITIIEAPPEASAEGRFIYMVRKFCTGFARADSREDILIGKVWTDKGYYHFLSESLFTYLRENGFNDIPKDAAWPILHSIGGRSDRLSIKGVTHSLYKVPLFDEEQNDDVTLMEIPDEGF